MGTETSPRALIGSSRSTRRRSTVTPCWPRKSTMSCGVTEPKSLPSSDAWRRSSQVRASIRARTLSASALIRPAFASCCRVMWSRFLRLPLVALRASFLGSRRLRAKPSETSFTSPRRPTLLTSSSRITFMATSVRGHVRQERHRAGPLDGVRQLALMPGAAARDPTRNDLAALRDQAAQAPDVLVIDEVDLVRTELADLAPAEPASLCRLLGCRNGCLLFSFPGRFPRRSGSGVSLEGHVVVAAPGLLGERSPGRCRSGRPRPLRTTHGLDALGHDLGHRALLAVLGFPVTGLQPALDEDLASLVQIFAAGFRLLAPHHYRQEAGVLALLAALRGVVTIDRHPKVGHGGTVRSVAELRRPRQIADQQDFVQARHQPTSSSALSPTEGRSPDGAFSPAGDS